MFPLCCRGVSQNLQLSCLFIGVIELALCIARFGIFIDHLSYYNKLLAYKQLSIRILVLTLESNFFVQLLSAVMITVGSDQKSRGFLITFLFLSFLSVIIFLPVMIVSVVYGHYNIIFAWLVFMGPEFYFWIVVIYYMRELRAESDEYGSTQV